MPTAFDDRIERLTQLDSDSTTSNAQLDSVLKCLSDPLEWLSSMSPTEQLVLVQHTAWKKHVWLVFKDILPNWTFALTSSHRQYLNDTLFIQLHTADERVKAAMAQVSLPVLLECLSAQKDATLDTLEIYAACLKLISLSSHIYPLYAKYVSANNIQFFCSLLCSISGHLVNAFGIQFQDVRFNTEHEWYIDRNFYSKLSKRIAENLTEQSIVFTQEMLSKIIRQGYGDIAMKSLYTIAKQSPKNWPMVFSKIEAMASPEQVIKPLLYHIKQDVLPKSSITLAAKDLARVLFGEQDGTRVNKEHRIHEFLNTAILRMAKSSWADDNLARLVVTTAVFAEGVTTDQQLTCSGKNLLSEFVKRPIQTWTDPVFIKHASSRERLYITMSILTLFAYLSTEEIQYKIMMPTSLIRSVSSYFNTGDKDTAQLGAVMAEAISSRIDKDKPLDSGLLENNDALKQVKQLIFTTDAFNDSDGSEEDIPTDQLAIETDSEDENGEDKELDPDAEFCLKEANEDESEDEEFQAYHIEEESDDEGLKKQGSTKSQTKKPAFVRDLVRYLQDKEDPLKLEIGLAAAEEVIRRKADAGTELSESCDVLAKHLITFPETYEIQDFRKLQQNALIALIAAVPESATGAIIDELYDRNTSNGQKQLILGSISLAVRELAGWSNNNTTEDTRHRLEGLEIPDEKLQIGTPLFVSKRMEVEKLHQQKIKRNKLSGLAGPVFFFPLLVGWWEGAQGRIQHWIGNNQVLAERFIMTLNIILHSSTNTPDKRKIVQEYFEFVSSMRYASNISQGVKKALLLGIDTIVNISYKGQEQLLFNDYNRQLSEVKDWLEVIMESDSEQGLQEIAVNVLMRISQIALRVT